MSFFYLLSADTRDLHVLTPSFPSRRSSDPICYSVIYIEDGFKLVRIAFAEAVERLHGLLQRVPPRYVEISDEPWKIAYLRAKVIGDQIGRASCRESVCQYV